MRAPQRSAANGCAPGVDTFYLFNPLGLVSGTYPTGHDHALVSGLLTELDDMVGCGAVGPEGEFHRVGPKFGSISGL
jgi:hypothetical protein